MRRTIWSLGIAVALVASSTAALSGPVGADVTTCDPITVEFCEPTGVATPLGLVDVVVGDAGVVVVRLTPSDPIRTRVIGLPFQPGDPIAPIHPPNPILPVITRTAIPTSARTVYVDTVVWSGPLRRFLPDLALVSLARSPGDPVVPSTSGYTVTFTPRR